MDGVLYHGDRALPHAVVFMRLLQSKPHIFITNNPILLPEDIAKKLQTLGFSQPELSKILTSGIATADWLFSQKPGFRYFAIGADGLHQALQKQGVEDASTADFVVIGEGAGIDYASLTTAINLIIKKNATLVLTNPDTTVDGVCNDRHCILPGGGALVAPIQIATGVEPMVVGKPEPLMFQMALARLKLPADQCLMIGDRPDTDILGAQSLGIKTALVRTGRFRIEQRLPDGIAPDIDVPDLEALQLALNLCP